ncbi:MAG: glycosyltransferase [Actinobacteria bacterium]|nr:MAG: glycosyltransferase [Actinomycetota bacterium]
MSKWPAPGEVKTRLAARVGNSRAARVQASMLRETVRRHDESGRAAWLAISPASSRGDFARSFPHARLVEQGQGDLGRRLERVCGRVLEDAEKVVVVGSDSPDLPSEYVSSAFARLSRAEVVLGPTRDGGIYLIAMTRLFPGLFQDVPWGTPNVFEALKRNAKRQRLTLSILAPWRDVDTLTDYVCWLLRRLRRKP